MVLGLLALSSLFSLPRGALVRGASKPLCDWALDNFNPSLGQCPVAFGEESSTDQPASLLRLSSATTTHRIWCFVSSVFFFSFVCVSIKMDLFVEIKFL